MNRRHILSTAGLFTALLFACVGLPQQVGAIEGESIVLSPASKPLKLDAGQTVKDSITIINDGTAGYNFKVYAAPYSVKNGTYEADYSTVLANTDIYRWVTFQRTDWHVEPGERIEVPFTIEVPADAAPGGHYGVLFAETQPKESQSQIMRKKRVGAIMYSTVNGTYIKSGQVTGVTLDWVQVGGPIRAKMAVENTGNVDITMTESLRIKDIFGNARYDKTTQHILLPKTNRDLVLEWQNGASLGWYNVTVESTVLDHKTSSTQLVFIAPLWFYVVAVAAVALLVTSLVWRLWFRHR